MTLARLSVNESEQAVRLKERGLLNNDSSVVVTNDISIKPSPKQARVSLKSKFETNQPYETPFLYWHRPVRSNH